MVEIVTPRLRLIALDLRHLRLMAQSRQYLEKALDLFPFELQIDPEIAQEIHQAIDFWLMRVESNPSRYAWYTHWEIVLTEKNHSIGGIGMSGFPDEDGKTMVGYVIDDRFHNQGFATESLEYLSRWAGEEEKLQYLVAETPLENRSSQRVLEKNGFTETGKYDQTSLWERHFP